MIITWETTLATATLPTITANSTLVGRTIEISVDSVTGIPEPNAPSLTVLTLEGADVLGEETGLGQGWAYDVPNSESSQTVNWTVTATNSVGIGTASGSEVVSANFVSPSVSSAPTITGTVQPGQTVTINEGTYNGTPAPTITGVLTLDGVDVSGDMSGLDYTIPNDTVGEDLTWDETAANGVAPDATQSVTEIIQSVSPDTDPPVVINDGYDDTDKTIDLDLEDQSPPINIYWAWIADANTADESDIENGTGDVLEFGSYQVTTGNSVTNVTVTDPAGEKIQYFTEDSLGNRGAVRTLTGATYVPTATLTNVVDTADGGTAATWGVESDTALGTIYAGLRLDTDPKLDAADIIATTGNCLQTDTDTTPTADANNGGTFSRLALGTGYVVDVTQDTGFNDITPSISGDGFTTSSTLDSDADNYISRVEAADGQALEASVVNALNYFFIDLKANSLLSNMGTACILAGARTIDGALEPLLPGMPQAQSFNFVSGDYDRKLGLKGDGSTKYIDTNRANNVSGQNDQTLSVHLTAAPTNPSTGQRLGGSGALTVVGNTAILLLNNNYLFSSRADGGQGAESYLTVDGVGSSTGFISVYRQAGTTISVRINGSFMTKAVASSTPNSGNIFIFASPDGVGGATAHSTARISFFEEGTFKSPSTMDTLVSQLMTDLDGAIA